MPNPDRRRLRHKPVTTGYGQWIADIHGTAVIDDLKPSSLTKKMEFMVDTIGYQGCDFNPCFHDKLLVVAQPLPQLTWEADPLNPADCVTYSFTGENNGIRWPELIDICRHELTPPFNANDLDDFAAQAEHHFKTAVDDTHSLLNFIIELIQMCEGNIVKLRELGKKISDALKAFHRMYERTGDFWLSWNFCIKPTIRDLHAMANVLERARKRLDWLRKRNNLDTKVKYRQGPWTLESVYETSNVVWPEPVGPMYVVPPNTSIRIKYVIKTVPSSWGWVRFSIPSYLLEGFEGLGIVWAALAGLYNPVKVGWEAVPFSWLIDWFVSRRTQLQLEAASLSPLKDADILGTGHALLTTVEGTIEFVGPPFEMGSGTPQVFELGQFRYEQYNRHAGLPVMDILPFRIPFEWYNFSILAALFQQKHRRG